MRLNKMRLNKRLDRLEAPLLERARHVLCAFRLCEEVEAMLGEQEGALSADTYERVEEFMLAELDRRLEVLLEA